MKFGIAKNSSTGSIVFTNSPEESVKEYCVDKRNQRDSKCLPYYHELLSNHDSHSPIEYHLCPYGLVTTSSIGGCYSPIVLNGLLTNEIRNPKLPENVIKAAMVTEGDLKNSFNALKEILEGIRNEELSHFEAAIHDARHLNHSISQNAENMLTEMGYPQDSNWDMQEIQKDEFSRRTLSIFAASRDLSHSILLHEISRDPSQAKSNINNLHIHKLFYRQIRISSDRMAAAGVTYLLGNTLKTLRLSSAFRVIPKILIDNAIKYASRNSEINVNFYESTQYLIIECKNYGPIVRDDEIGGLFMRGVRGSNRSGAAGEGIGLWLAKVIVEANNGIIKFEIRDNARDYAGRRMGETIITIKLPNT